MSLIDSNWFISPDPPYCFGYAILKDKHGRKHIFTSVGVGTDHYNKPEYIGTATGPPPSSILDFLEYIGSIFYLK